MELYLAVLIGAVIYGLIDYLSSTENVFTLRYFLIILVNVLAGIALVWALDLQPKQFLVSDFDFTRIVAMTFGVMGQKLFKAIIKVADKNIRTRLGINKK